MLTLKQVVLDLKTEFESFTVEANSDALLLVAYAINNSVSYVKLHGDVQVNQDQLTKLLEYKERRKKREPVSKIIGSRGFWKLDFFVNNDVLDPRADSETLIETVLELKRDYSKDYKILDLGTGSGCLVQSLLYEYKNATGIGVDISDKALDVAIKNADINKLSNRFIPLKANWNNTEDVKKIKSKGPFDIIICNPPYIENDYKLEPEVLLYDPNIALFGGKDGLDEYRSLSKIIPEFLSEKGIAIFEYGQGQERDVRVIMEAENLKFIIEKKDLAEITRCSVFSL